MDGLGGYLAEKIRKMRDAPKPKRGGVTSYSSQLRAETAELLGEPFKKVAGLTRGFSNMQLERMLKASREWVNPPALWWKLYKTERQQVRHDARHYAKKGEVRRVRAVGEGRRGKDEANPSQGILF